MIVAIGGPRQAAVAFERAAPQRDFEMLQRHGTGFERPRPAKVRELQLAPDEPRPDKRDVGKGGRAAGRRHRDIHLQIAARGVECLHPSGQLVGLQIGARRQREAIGALERKAHVRADAALRGVQLQLLDTRAARREARPSPAERQRGAARLPGTTVVAPATRSPARSPRRRRLAADSPADPWCRYENARRDRRR